LTDYASFSNRIGVGGVDLLNRAGYSFQPLRAELIHLEGDKGTMFSAETMTTTWWGKLNLKVRGSRIPREPAQGRRNYKKLLVSERPEAGNAGRERLTGQKKKNQERRRLK